MPFLELMSLFSFGRRFADIKFSCFLLSTLGVCILVTHVITSLSLSLSASCGKVFLQVLLKLPKELKRRETAERKFYFVCSSPY